MVGRFSSFSLGLCALALLCGHTSQATFLRTTQRDDAQQRDPHYWECYFGQGTGCSGGDGSISPQTRDEVANILKGMISNLSKHKDFMQLAKEASKAKKPEVKKALLGLLGAFKTDREAATQLVGQLTGAPKASLAAMSGSLSKTVAVPAKPAPPPAKPSTSGPQGPVVKK